MNTGQVKTQRNQLLDPFLITFNPMEESTQQGIEGSMGYKKKYCFVGSVLILCISRVVPSCELRHERRQFDSFCVGR